MQFGSINVNGIIHQSNAGGIQVGSGSTATRPANAAGSIRYNTDFSRLELNNGSTWANVAITGDYVALSGGVMTGLLTLSADPTTALGATTKQYVDNAVANAISADTYTATAAGGLTLTGKAFSANTTSVTTGIVGGNIAVRSTASSGQTLLSSGTAGGEAAWGALNLASANAVTGALGLANGGTGGTSAATARTNLVVPSIYRTSFTNAGLTAGVLPVTHSLNQQFVHVMITDSTNALVVPDAITMSNTTALSVDFTSYGTLTGTYNIIVVG